MKKLLLIFLFLFILTGCNSYSKEKEIYNNMINDLNNQSIINGELPFSVDVVLEKDIDEELTYSIIIDNPKEEIRNIKALAIHNFDTNGIYPTVGIFDEKLNLIPNKIDNKNNMVKGIILVGYIKYNGSINNFNGIIKLLLEYEDEDDNNKKVYYQYQKETK
ncbi:MAG: lipoprotein [Bacilli bacterium]